MGRAPSTQTAVAREDGMPPLGPSLVLALALPLERRGHPSSRVGESSLVVEVVLGTARKDLSGHLPEASVSGFFLLSVKQMEVCGQVKSQVLLRGGGEGLVQDIAQPEFGARELLRRKGSTPALCSTPCRTVTHRDHGLSGQTCPVCPAPDFMPVSEMSEETLVF